MCPCLSYLDIRLRGVPAAIIVPLSTILDRVRALQSFLKCRSDPLGSSLKSSSAGASLVAQWLGVCLLMQGTRVRALVWEDPTCRGAAGPVSHNC